MAEAASFVIDASVGAKVVLEEEGSAEAEAMLLHWQGAGPRSFHVPDHFYLECGTALRKAILRGVLPAEVARERLLDLCEMEVEVADARGLAADALAIAGDAGLSVYDAAYVALSDLTGAPLVTADRRLHERLRRTGHRVLGLWEVPAA